jgi:hypothetical protein
MAARELLLAGVVGAVGEPDLQVTGAGGIHDVDAFEVVIDGLLADRRVGVGEGSELVVIVLEGVRVDGAEGHTVVGCESTEGGVVLDFVPGNVQGDRRGQRGVLVHLGGIRDLLLRGARGSWGAEYFEPGARVAERPGRKFDGLLGELRLDRSESGHDVILFCGVLARWSSRLNTSSR